MKKIRLWFTSQVWLSEWFDSLFSVKANIPEGNLKIYSRDHSKKKVHSSRGRKQ